MIRIFDKLEEYLLVSSLAVLVFLVFLQVVMRYFFGMSLTWSEEIARFLFLWMVWLGAAYATKRKSHLKIEAFTQKLSPQNKKRIDLLSLVIWILFTVFLVWKGGELTAHLVRRSQLSPVLGISMAWIYAAVPTGAGLMLLRLFFQLREALTTDKDTPSGEVIR